MKRVLACFGVAFAPLALSAPAHAQYAPAPGQPAPNGYPPGYPGAPATSPYPTPVAPQPQLQPVNTPPEEDESQDSGLGLEWVWLNADAGYGYANLTSLSQSSLGLVKTESSGPTFGVGAGVRLLFFTLGLRARDLQLQNIGDLWELGAEAAFHLRVWHIDPYFGVRGGYNFVGTLNTSTVDTATGNTPPSVSVHGFNVGPMVGIDYYFVHWISLGADVDAQFLFLQRPSVAIPQSYLNNPALSPAQRSEAQQLASQSGSSAGFQLTPTLHLGIHF